MRNQIRALVALALLIGFYVLVVVVPLGFLAAVVFLLHEGVVRGSVGYLAALGIFVTYTLVSAVLASFRGSPDEDGLLVTPEQEPGLWTTVRELAATVGTRPPDEIRLVPDVNAAVSEDARLLGLIGGRRRMYVGVPLLLGLSKDQVTSVLGHELGHYSGRHTRFGSAVRRGLGSVEQVAQDLGHRSPAGRLFTAYARTYVRIAYSSLRAQEVEADLTSARIAGRDVAIAALRELPALGIAWERFLVTYVGPAEPLGMRPLALAEGFLDFLGDPDRRASFDPIRNDTHDPGHSPFDTHPTRVQRIARLAQLPADLRFDDGLPGYALLSDPDGTMRAFEDLMWHDDDAVPTSWDTLLPAVEARRAESETAVLVAAMAETPLWQDRPIRLVDVVSELRSGRGAELARMSSNAERWDDVDEVQARLVASVVGTLLVEKAGGAYRTDWSGRRVLTDPSGRVVDAHGLGERVAASARTADEVVDLLGAYGVDVFEPLVFRDRPLDGGGTERRAVACLAPVRDGWREVTLLVCTHGLAVLRPRGTGEWLAFWFARMSLNTARKIAGLVLDRPLEEVLARPGAEVVPWEQVEKLHVRRRVVRRPHLEITDVTGRTRHYRFMRHSDVFGEPWAHLSRVLGDRLVADRAPS